jgi:hypothetical protein
VRLRHRSETRHDQLEMFSVLRRLRSAGVRRLFRWGAVRAGPQGDDNVVALTSRETLNAARTLVKVQSCTGRHPADGTITGGGTGGIAKCHTFGPVTGQRDLQYHLDTLSGAATTNLLKNRGKFLEQLH